MEVMLVLLSIMSLILCLITIVSTTMVYLFLKDKSCVKMANMTSEDEEEEKNKRKLDEQWANLFNYTGEKQEVANE